MTVTNEKLILSALCKNERFLREILPHLETEFFDDPSERYIFKAIRDYAGRYNAPPDRSTLQVNVKNDYDISERDSETIIETLREVFSITPSENYEWLYSTVEEFCKQKKVYNAINKAIAIYQGEDKDNLTVAAIPDILSNAISLSFDKRVGMDFFDDAEARYDHYVNPDARIPFRIPEMNEVTCGGITRKTLNLLISGTNVGKSMSLVSLAADYVKDGLDVLYVSFEMSESAVLSRLDANLLNVPVNEISTIGKDRFVDRVQKLREKSYGRFVVKEFPPGGGTALSIRQVIEELKMKRKYTPDIVMVDYIQITGSYRQAMSAGSYYYYKAVAEELRALAVEHNVVVWTASQFNRKGMGDSEAGIGDISESAGIAHTADGIWALIRTEELDSAGQILIRQLKTRYANRATRSSFALGVDIDRQQLYGLDDDDRPFDNVATDNQLAISTENLKDKFLNFK